MELKFHENIQGSSMLYVEMLDISKYGTVAMDIKESNKRCKEIGHVTRGSLLQKKLCK